MLADRYGGVSEARLEFSPRLIPVLRVAATALLAGLLVASCSGGAGSSSDPAGAPVQAATFRYPAPPVYVIGTAIAPLTPEVTGGLYGFVVIPYLPPGLVLDPATGIIAGRPTAASAGTSYTVSAATADGQVINAAVDITVNAVGPSQISYGASAFTFTAGIPGRILTPLTRGPVTGWSITPQLPAGLSFDTASGSIAGTPTAASPPTTYTVTAQASASQLSVTLTIEVDTDVLVDLGHNTNILVLQFNGSSVLSEDDSGHWVLWDYATSAIISSGDSGCVFGCQLDGPVAALAGSTAVIRTHTGFEVRSAATGALTAIINASVLWWSLAADGSYFVAADTTALTAWSPSGQLLISHSGNYSGAIGFASPGAIRIGAGPAGSQVVETISVPSGADTVSPAFKGQFNSWFVDGSGFLSTSGGTVMAYSDTAVQEASLSIPNHGTLSGQGPWLWTFSGDTLNVYALASPTAPVASYSFPDNFQGLAVASASTIGVWDWVNDTFSVIDLAGTHPAKVDYASPFGALDGVTTYAATSASQWVVGYQLGVLLDGASPSRTPRFFGYGQALSLAGNANRIAIATASGSILYFNAVTLAQEGAIPFSSSQVALSSDGSILAAASSGGQSVNIYSLPSGSLLYSWPYPASANAAVESISLSDSGSVLGVTTQQTLQPGAGIFTQTAVAPTGGALISSTTFSSPGSWPPPLRISHDGTGIAISTWGNPDMVQPAFIDIAYPPALAFKTKVLQNGTLISTVAGWPVGWTDDTHLLVNSYIDDRVSDTTGDFAGCTIYDRAGNVSGTCDLPEVLSFQTVTSDTLYALNLDAMVSVSTGAVSWMSGDPLTPAYTLKFVDALAGNHVVLVSGTRLVAQSY